MGASYPTCDPGLYPTKGVNPLSGIKETYCAPCPLGFYCIGGDKGRDSKPQPCDAGYYGRAVGMSSRETACMACPEGFSCMEGADFPKRCGPGSYSPAGASECTLCNAGWHCPGSTGDPIQCAKGHFAPVPGMAYCTPCPVGMYCEFKEGLNLMEPKLCAEGTY